MAPLLTFVLYSDACIKSLTFKPKTRMADILVRNRFFFNSIFYLFPTLLEEAVVEALPC